MNFLSKSLIVSCLILLTACGGHGFEGSYQSKVESAFMQGMSKNMPKSTLVIGSDFIEIDGKRTQADDISVRDSANKKYLVVNVTGQEQVLEIIDDNTLQQDLGVMKITFKRI